MSTFSSYIASDIGRAKLMTVVVGLAGAVVVGQGLGDSSYATANSNCKQGCPTHTDGCPSRPGAWVGLACVILCFIGSAVAIVLFMIMFAKLTDNPKMKTIDTVGHLIAGIISLSMGAFCVYWSTKAYLLNPCGSDSSDQCSNNRSSKMSPIVVGVGGIIFTVNGALYIIIGLKIGKEAGTTAAEAAA